MHSFDPVHTRLVVGDRLVKRWKIAAFSRPGVMAAWLPHQKRAPVTAQVRRYLSRLRPSWTERCWVGARRDRISDQSDHCLAAMSRVLSELGPASSFSIIVSVRLYNTTKV